MSKKIGQAKVECDFGDGDAPIAPVAEEEPKTCARSEGALSSIKGTNATPGYLGQTGELLLSRVAGSKGERTRKMAKSPIWHRTSSPPGHNSAIGGVEGLILHAGQYALSKSKGPQWCLFPEIGGGGSSSPRNH